VKSPSSSTTLAKAYGIKVRCLYAEHVEEGIVNLGNILGTHYELRRNTVRTHWEKWLKKNPSRPPNLKGIKARHLGPSHSLKGK